MRTLLLCCCLLFVSVSLAQQQGTLKGVVVDKETGTPIPMVNIYLRDTNQGTTTDSLGSFMLTLPAEKRIIVSFSHVAYWKESYEVELIAGDVAALTVELEPRMVELDAVTITAGRGVDEIFAKVITERDIEERGFRSMTDVLRWAAPSALSGQDWHLRTSILLPAGERNLRLYWKGTEIDPQDIDIINPYLVEKILIWNGTEAPIAYTWARSPIPLVKQRGADALPTMDRSTNRSARYVIEIRTKF